MTKYLEHIWNQLCEFRSLTGNSSGGTARSERAALLEILRNDERPSLDTVRTSIMGTPPRRLVIDTMERWVAIEYPGALAEMTGAFGTFIRASDALRLAAKEDPKGGYFAALADKLDAHPMPRPVFSDPAQGYLNALEGWMLLVKRLAENPAMWSEGTLADVYLMSRDAFFLAERGRESCYSVIEYPLDFQRPESDSGERSEMLSFPTGMLIRHLAESAKYVSDSERALLRQALMFYPDEEFELEVATSAGDRFWLISPSIARHGLLHPNVGDPIGSVHLDHYGIESQFSPIPTEYEFRLHLPLDGGDGDDPDSCILISDALTYVASAVRD